MYIDKKKEMLALFFQKTCELEQMLEKEQYEQLDGCLNERGELIQAITLLDQEAGTALRRQAALKIAPLLQAMVEKEKAVQEIMIYKKNIIAEELRKINASKKVNHSYQSKAYNSEGYFIDRTIRSR